MLLRLFALALLPALARGQDVETLTESWPDGSARVEREVIRDEAGLALSHGDFKSWHENGQQAEEGRYKNGVQVDTWRTWHPNGQLASRGVFRRGLRTQKWTYLDENGARDGGESGDYRAEFNEYPDGQPESRGEYRFKSKHGDWVFFHPSGGVRERGRFKLDKRTGPWVSFWPGGGKLLEGEYERGRKIGRWTFFHPNGCPDAAFLAGVYAKGERLGPGPEDLLAPDSPWLDVAALPDPEPFPLSEGDGKELAQLFARFQAGAGGQDEGRLDELVQWEHVCLPLALKQLKGLDLTRQADELVGYRLHHVLLHKLLNGHTFAWRSGTAPDDVAHNKRTILRWLTLWRLARGDTAFWETVASSDAEAEPELLFLPPLLAGALTAASEEDPAAVALDAAARLLSLRERGRLVREYGGRGTEDALAAALAWLATAQSKAGNWDADNWHTNLDDLDLDECGGPGHPRNDVGVTGLALLAFLGAGNSVTDGDYSEVVERAVKWLSKRQDKDSGRFDAGHHDFVYGHAIATIALCEADRAAPSPVLRNRVQKALDFILAGQNQGLGWRYEMPPVAGDNDTSVTSWMVVALTRAREYGYRVAARSLADALRWFDRVTEVTTGRVGYDSLGSLSARVVRKNDDYPSDLGEPMTAAVLFCRFLADQDPRKLPVMNRHAALLLDKLPAFEPEKNANDMYYWYYGTYAMFQVGGERWDTWNQAMKRAVLDSQRTGGPCAGSWDPIGPWGHAGGRVYSTALMALTLEVYYRHPRRLE